MRNVDPTSVAGRKGKTRAVGKGTEEVAMTAAVAAEEEEAKAAAETVVAESGVLGWEENWWQWLSGVVLDEQMSWGSIWLPFWDVEFMGESSSYSLFSDAEFWDDDIWGIRGSMNEIPPDT